jgi:osmoprotectant transport system substrate-binding protein
MKRKIIALLIVMIMTLVMSACGNSENSTKGTNENTETKEVINPDDPIVVSTMNDTEGEVLGRMMVLALKDAGFEVTDNTFGYTGTANGRTALLEGETDIYMDYTGRGLSLIEGVDIELYRDLETAWESVSTWDAKTNNLIWLRYAPLNNTDAVSVTRKFAEENNVYSWVDFADYVNNGGFVKMVTYDYWVTIPTGLPGMEKTYGFKLDKDQYTIVSANNEQMLAEGTDGVNASMMFSSSGLVDAYDLVVLEDPEHVSPVYSPTPIIRKERLDKYPKVKEVLDKVFESITLEEMREMNKQVQVDGASGIDVAREYLLSKNLIEE